jgi:pimeloyl-ACP methyl ester carboxylesterase
VAAALARLGVEDCTVVGHSLGGGVAAELVEQTDRIASLALIAPVGFGRIRLAERITLPGVLDVATLALPLALVNPLTVTAAYAAFVGHGRLPERELLERLRHRAARAPLGVRAATLAIAHAGRADDGLPHRRLAFDGPVSALWGTRDALVPPAHAAGVLAALPQAHVEVWDGMGHHPQRERPRQLAHFLAQHAAGADGAAHRVAA